MSEQIIDLAPVYEQIKAAIPADATHLLLLIPSRRSVSLWRLSDCMYRAECADKTAIMGENPNKRESRLFISHEAAVEFVRSVARGEVEGAVLFEHDIERGLSIVLPNGESSLVVNGSHRVDGRMPTGRKLN